MNPSLVCADGIVPPEDGPALAVKRVCAELTPVQQAEINNTIKTRRLMKGFGYLLYIRFDCQKKSDKGKGTCRQWYVQSRARARGLANAGAQTIAEPVLLPRHFPNCGLFPTCSHPLIANRSFGK